jgi:hypothetical protein
MRVSQPRLGDWHASTAQADEREARAAEGLAIPWAPPVRFLAEALVPTRALPKLR